MGFEETLSSMRESIRSSLDELASPRSSPSSKTTALKKLEGKLAMACIATTNGSDTKDAFLALQHTFECNIPSHLLPWITLSTLRLEGLTSRSLAEGERTSEMEELGFQLNLSLSLIQGIVLNHKTSKEHLGRKCSLEILLDLLLASRYLPAATPDSASTNSEASSHPSPPHVTSVVLDTLLCILVDSTAALRTFESAGGVHAVVKILKRFGTPREVRMKCLEFLYFYLLDETPSSDSVSLFVAAAQPAPTPPTAPATPIRPTKQFIAGNTPLRPISRYGSSTYSFSGSSSPGSLFFTNLGGNSSSSPSGGSSSAPSTAKSMPSLVAKTLRSTSGSSTNSFSSTSSNASSSTAVSSVEGSPSSVKEAAPPLPVFIPLSMAGKRSPVKGLRSTTPQSQLKYLVPPPNSPPSPSGDNANRVFSAQPRSLMLLRKEVDYVPQSPKKVLVPGVGRPSLVTASSQPVVGSANECNRRVHRKSLSVSMAGNVPVPSIRKRSDAEKMRTPGTPIKRTAEHSTATAAEVKKVIQADDKAEKENKRVNWKTLEEKKELLGTMLGNVDALVDGVRKAGVWGLG